MKLMIVGSNGGGYKMVGMINCNIYSGDDYDEDGKGSCDDDDDDKDDEDNKRMLTRMMIVSERKVTEAGGS